jgi:hypothetical protein
MGGVGKPRQFSEIRGVFSPRLRPLEANERGEGCLRKGQR